jgi:hypothetical protein
MLKCVGLWCKEKKNILFIVVVVYLPLDEKAFDGVLNWCHA